MSSHTWPMTQLGPELWEAKAEGLTIRLRDRVEEVVLSEMFDENVYQLPKSCAGQTVVDIGAHKGIFTLHALARGAARAYAFEPDPANFAWLEDNVKRNGFEARVVARNVGIWSGEGSEKLYICNAPYAHFMGKPEGENAFITVPTIGLDQALEGIAVCDILKFDCEGAEFQIICSASDETLSRVKFVTMEVHPLMTEAWGEPELYDRMLAKLARHFKIDGMTSNLLGFKYNFLWCRKP